MNKNKIVNDPVWGFVTIPFELSYDIINHPYFQRLRRIVQMGLSYIVYPGAMHTRFHHSIGCMYLMKEALDTLQSKGVEISNEEKEAACAAILLHDIGHGPFSHVLEHSLLPSISHEEMSKLFMHSLNKQWNGRLDMAIAIFGDTYHKKFLHQLVSGQLDVDRLDYLNRDSFYTGVTEGAVGTERLIKMMNVCDGKLVVEEKGIYSLEKFVLSRRMMFWQVYLHKTSVCAEQMLIHCIERAKSRISCGEKICGTGALLKLLSLGSEEIIEEKNIDNIIKSFASIDDSDIWVSLKEWALSEDRVMSSLSLKILDRTLFRVELQNEMFTQEYIKSKEKEVLSIIKDPSLLPYFCYQKELTPKTYNPRENAISVLRKDGSVVDITKVSDLLDKHFVMKSDTKYLLCYL